MSCVICNNCEGWEFSTSVGNEQPLKPRLKAFNLKTELEGLARSVSSGCVTCSIFYDAITHFFPGISREQKLEGWIPKQPHLPNLVLKSSNHDNFKEGSFIQFYTAPGNIETHSLELSSLFLCNTLSEKFF
jgi:hypothetical protein